ncbi:MAG: type I DNA topoisomerase [Planctomycetota bacterium]
MGKTLVIVESPTKAKTIAGFLPRNFVVESSLGHVRDLPRSAKEIPPEVKGQPWARLGINIEKDFEPLYVIPAEKKKVVQRLRQALKGASALYLATDEDREGESISWHLVEVLKPKVAPRRLVFHEITREAIEEALRNPREISERLVEAQETRRILDRLCGYEVSPVLWRKIAPRLSAGRVQSVAIRMIVERERERMRFVRSEYWDIAGRFRTEGGGAFEATLVSVGGKRVAQGGDFDPETGRLRENANGSVLLVDERLARELAERLRSGEWKATLVERKPDVERPAPPFTTSTLQQEANRKLRLSARETMATAQRLYESGYITYMRTDSTTLSEQTVRQTRRRIEELYGRDYLSPAPRQYATRVKNAQEAHEAIRPSADFRLPEELRGEIGGADWKLYDLIWKRTVACQMADAKVHATTLQVSEGSAVFQATGRTIEFPGFLRAYVEGADDPDARLADRERPLPPVEVSERVFADELEAKRHATQPPRRYTEASLVKDLEANGIGRPSTYATIIDTILRREYVTKQGNNLVPTFTAFAVVNLLEKNFAELVDIQFTARMEDDLDAISLGEKRGVPYLKSFYFGNGEKVGLRQLLENEIDPRESCTIRLGKDKEGREISVRIGRYGPYLERGDERAPIPAGTAPDELTLERAEELLRGSAGPRLLGCDPETGKPVYVKSGRFGPYVQLGDNGGEPRMKSLLPGMRPDEIDLETALRLLSLPRSLGADPATGEEVFADFGRFGAYVKRGSESRSLPSPASVFEVTLGGALELLRQEKPRRGWRSRPPAVLRELGKLPDSGREVRLMQGRYGPYVTDGTTNAKVPSGTDLNEITLEEAASWIAERAARGPKPRTARWTKVSPRALPSAPRGAPRRRRAPKASLKAPSKAARGKKPAKKAARRSKAAAAARGADRGG